MFRRRGRLYEKTRCAPAPDRRIRRRLQGSRKTGLCVSSLARPVRWSRPNQYTKQSNSPMDDRKPYGSCESWVQRTGRNGMRVFMRPASRVSAVLGVRPRCSRPRRQRQRYPVRPARLTRVHEPGRPGVTGEAGQVSGENSFSCGGQWYLWCRIAIISPVACQGTVTARISRSALCPFLGKIR